MEHLFFIASKLIWTLIRPESWIVILLAVALVAVWRGARRLALTVLVVNLVFLLAVGNWTLWHLVMVPLEQRYPPAPPLQQVDGIILLGGAELSAQTRVWGAPQFDDEAERFTETLALARRFPQAKVIFTGGHNSLLDLGRVSQGQSAVARMFFAQQGIAPERLVLESASRNTAENATLTYALIQPRPDQHWVLVTSANHMPRSMKSFERAGWTNITAWPTDFRSIGISPRPHWDLARNLDNLNVAVREHVGLLAYDLTGR